MLHLHLETACFMTAMKVQMGRDLSSVLIAPSGIRARVICKWFKVSNRFLLAHREDF